MNLIQTKVVSILSLGLASIFVGLIPASFANRGRQQWPLFLSNLLCFGGGVLISTSLIHILPEVREVAPEAYKPYTEIVFCAGFFILYMIDEIVHYFYGDTQEANILHNLPKPSATHRRHSTTYGATENNSLLTPQQQPPYNPSFYRVRSDSVLFVDDAPSQLCHVGHQEPCHTAPTANVGLLVALSVHALLEGLVVGLEDLSGKVWLMLGAIASHKLVVGFCLGMELASTPTIKFCRHFVYIFIFTSGSVIGIIIGMFITNIPSGLKNVVIPLLQGLAGGTLLYVTVSEVLPRERARWHQQHEKRSAGICQFVSAIIGFGIMTALSKYLDFD